MIQTQMQKFLFRFQTFELPIQQLSLWMQVFLSRLQIFILETI